MKIIIKILLLVVSASCILQAVDISPQLSQQVATITEQIQQAQALDHSNADRNTTIQARLLTEIAQPIHEYIMNNAHEFLPYFSTLYCELDAKLLTSVAQIASSTQYRAGLIVALKNALTNDTQRVLGYVDIQGEPLDQFLNHVHLISQLLNARPKRSCTLPTSPRSPLPSSSSSSFAAPAKKRAKKDHAETQEVANLLLAVCSAHQAIDADTAALTTLECDSKSPENTGAETTRTETSPLNDQPALSPLTELLSALVATDTQATSSSRLPAKKNLYRIEELLVKKGLTEADLAKKSRLSAGYIAQLINGSRICSLVNLRKIAYILGVTDHELFTPTDNVQLTQQINNYLLSLHNPAGYHTFDAVHILLNRYKHELQGTKSLCQTVAYEIQQLFESMRFSNDDARIEGYLANAIGSAIATIIPTPADQFSIHQWCQNLHRALSASSSRIDLQIFTKFLEQTIDWLRENGEPQVNMTNS